MRGSVFTTSIFLDHVRLKKPIHYLSLSELTPLLIEADFRKEKTRSWRTDGLTGYDTQAKSNIEQLNYSP